MLTRLSRFIAAAFAAATLAAGATGCSSAPARPEITAAEQKKIDDSIGREFGETLEKRFMIRRDSEAEIYLRGLALRVMQGVPALRESPAGVLILREPPTFAGGERVHSLGLPGMRLYLSLEFLRSVEFENELAAAIALQISHVHERHLARNLQLLPAEDRKRSVLDDVFPPPEEGVVPGRQILGEPAVFKVSEDEMAKSIGGAVEMLYRAGYDPRGLVELWKRDASIPGKTLYSTNEIDQFIRQTYRAIARYTPLRNPVVRSGPFLAFKKRISGT